MTAPTAEPPPDEQTSRPKRKGKGKSAPTPGAAPEPPKLRRRPMLVAVSVLLTALGALLGAFLLSSLSGTDDYIAVSSGIERGERITAQDLSRTQLRKDTNITPIRWDQRGAVIGTYATNDMAEGSIVTQDSIAAEISPKEGDSIVGLALTPGQGVSGELRVGQSVQVVLVPASAELSSQPEKVPGEVSAVKLSDDGSTKLVDVQVDSGNAPKVAASAARQEASLVVLGETEEGDVPLTPSGEGDSSTPTSESSTSN